ncbi:hypothetical protein IWX63_001345 [Arthrobacter sp. CAN_A2]|uniref:hypothetical protein n=1 Tax=Arthrobacter sp. CAN_A2 TaxID=2787718 RepID=UPI001A26441E
MPALPNGRGPADPDGPGRVLVPVPAALPERGRIKARGVVTSLTIAPVTSPPSFSVLAGIDWNGARKTVRIIWMGQRRVPGVEAGVALRFEGMLTTVDGTPTVYNPRYEIIGRPDENG